MNQALASSSERPLAMRLLRVVADFGPFNNVDFETIRRLIEKRSTTETISYDLLRGALMTLNQQGLIKISLTTGNGIRHMELTKNGQTQVRSRVPHVIPDGDPRDRQYFPPNGDRTDFRTHGDQAEGGPVSIVRPPDERGPEIEAYNTLPDPRNPWTEPPPAPYVPAPAEQRPAASSDRVSAIDRVLMWINTESQSSVYQRTISAGLRVGASDVSTWVRRAEELGLLTVDRRRLRKFVVRLTPLGKERAEALAAEGKTWRNPVLRSPLARKRQKTQRQSASIEPTLVGVFTYADKKKFPAIAELIARAKSSSEIIRAADILDKQGKTEIAVMVLEQAGVSFSDLETEVATYFGVELKP